MLLYLAVCDAAGTVLKVAASTVDGLVNEGADIRSIFCDDRAADELLDGSRGAQATACLKLRLDGSPSTHVTVRKQDGRMLVLAYRLDDPSQLPRLVELSLALPDALARIEDKRRFEEGYYEIQKLNSKLVNYQRTLAKTNAQLKRLLDETSAAQSTIAELKRDPLTGLLTESAFYSQAAALVAAHPDRPLDALAFDVEGFKIVNDAFGTDAGDRVLADLSALLAHLPAGEPLLLTRARADTFFALAPRRADWEDLIGRELGPFLESYPLPMSLQVKAGVYPLDDGTLPLPRVCDRALLAADSIKGSYNRLVALYDASMHEKLMTDQKIVDTMAESLDRGDFLVYLQPKVDLATGSVVGAEALVRWNHPDLGLIPPSQFIPVFEANGFVHAMDEFVWRRTCELLRDWRREGIAAVPVSVNVSRTDLYYDDLPATLAALVAEHGLSPADLHLEITETAYADDAQQLVAMTERLSAAGFFIEMDDFGSGYSSLTALSELPIDALKLDLKFLSRSKDANRRRTIMRSVIGLAHRLGLQAIAEGVETPKQASLLADMGCRFAQGYLFGRPQPESDFPAFLSRKEARS